MVSLPRRRLLKQWGLILLATVVGVNLLLLLLAIFAQLMERLALQTWWDSLLVISGGGGNLDSRLKASVLATDERLLLAEIELQEMTNDSVLLKTLSTLIQPPPIDIVRPCGRKKEEQHHSRGSRNHFLVVVFLFSSAENGVSLRKLIRETYGAALKRGHLAELYFVFGRTPSELEEQNLRAESSLHNDVLQFDFADEDNRLKSVATARWTALHCSHAQFALQLDDHYFIRVKPFLDTLTALSETSDRTIYKKQKENGHSKSQSLYLAPVARLAALYEVFVAASLQKEAIPESPFDEVLTEMANLTQKVLPGADQFLSAHCPNATKEEEDRRFTAEQTLRCLWATFAED